MKYLSLLILCLSIPFLIKVEAQNVSSKNNQVMIATQHGIRVDLLERIAPIVKESIRHGYYPGAVILAGHKGKIIYRGVFGNQRTSPDKAPMRLNTIFDIASLTKVVATAPAVMQLVEEGKVELDSHVAKYWPEFAKTGKEKITVRQLLTHTSGLPPDVTPGSKKEVFHRIEKMKLQNPIGTKFVYSDVNFIALAHLVELISGEPFERYVQSHLFQPLNMKETTFRPSARLKDRIAPTIIVKKKLRWGNVQDPIAYSMGGVAGHAGVFSTAEDLGRYAECLLKGGESTHGHILSPLSILKMTTPQTPSAISDVRALGWDMDSVYSNRGVLFSTQSFGHTGWTGTSIWIDPATQTWLIILTNRVHPTPSKSNQLVHDRRIIANILSGSITDVSIATLNNTGRGELHRSFPNV